MSAAAFLRSGGSREVSPSRPNALQYAAGALARRRLSEAELRARLAARGYPEGDADAAVARLRELGHLDDRALAADVVDGLRARGLAGAGRISAELRRRGLESARPVAEVADLRCAVDLHLARAGGRRDLRTYRRVYNALLRAGFEPDAIQEALDARFPDVSRDDPA